MQASQKEIYKQVAEKENISEDIVKLVGDAVFKEWTVHLKNPKSIILKIKKLGKMYLRKNKLEREVGKPIEEELKENYKSRLVEYDLYIDKKNAVREIRWKSQPLIPKIEDEPD